MSEKELSTLDLKYSVRLNVCLVLNRSYILLA